MNVTGAIKIVPRVRSGGDECHGITEAEGQRFKIRVAQSAFNDPDLFAETLLHELVHLWLFMLDGRDKRFALSNRRHHKIIDTAVPPALQLLKKFLWRKYGKHRSEEINQRRRSARRGQTTKKRIGDSARSIKGSSKRGNAS